MYHIVKGNQTANSKAYEEIIKDFPHIGNIISKLYISTDYAIGNIWDSGNSIVFYFYQSMGINFSNKELIELMMKYEVSTQVNMGDAYKFNISINKKLRL
jgi:hypothetical protein